jgi:hypothetical protein
LREADEGPAVMEFEPAAFDRELEPGRILRRYAPIDVQERTVDFLDVDAAILHNLEGPTVSDSFADQSKDVDMRAPHQRKTTHAF